MSDIKRIALVFLIVTVFFSSFSNYVYAANEYAHSELLEYEGYGQAMFESVVEQTAFITGQYTDNKEYVSQSIDEIIDYANFWKDDYENWDTSCNNDFTGCMRGMLESGGGLVLTVGDWFKNLFNDYDETENSNGSESTLAQYFYVCNETTICINSDYYFTFTGGNGNLTDFIFRVGTVVQDYTSNGIKYVFNQQVITAGNYTKIVATNLFNTSEEAEAKRNEVLAEGVSHWVGLLENLRVYANNNNVEQPTERPLSNPNIRKINNYYNENPLPSVVTPHPKPFLVCPDGTEIQMSISGSTFLAVDGTTMIVNKEGTAEVNGSICNLGWTKPVVDYDPSTDNPTITQPDGTKTDLITGDESQKPPGSDDLEGCSGVLCGIGKLLDGLGSVVSSIADLVKEILDGLVGLFVPKDLAFMTEEFNKITKKLNDKIAITNSLKEVITSLFDGGGSNPLANISINLPITNEPLSFGNVSFIDEGVPILRRVISAIVVLYTIAYVYRKITGRGGVMER